MLHNKKAQIPETLTWVPAALIIVLILAVTIIATIVLFRTSSFSRDSRTINVHYSSDLFAEKSLASYFLTTDNGETVYSELNSAGDFNNFNGNLAKNIFTLLYHSEYPGGVYLGFYNPNSLLTIENNQYFGSAPSLGAQSGLTGTVYIRQDINELIYLDKNKFLHLILAGGFL